MKGSGPARTILFVGRPGSGKETQARLLSEQTGFHVMSTGEKFRELRQHRDALGERVRAEYDAGRLIPDWFADYLLEDTMLKLSVGAGIIFEGSARTLEQARHFDEVAEWLERPYRVIHLVISEEEATRRQTSRAKVTDRPDSDTPEKQKIRADAYSEHTQKAINFFKEKGVLIEINGEGEIDSIHADIMSKFGIA